MKDPKFKSNLLLATYVVVLAFIFINIKSVGNIFGSTMGMLKPFLIAICIAFVLNIPMKFYEEKVLDKVIKQPKKRRPLAIILTIITIIAIVVGLVLFIIPQLVESGSTLVKNIPDYVKTLEMFMAEHFSKTEVFDELWNQVLSMGENIIKVVGQVTGSLVSQVVDITVGVTSTIINFFMGILIAIYILLSKEKLGIQAKKILYAFFDRIKADKVMEVARISHDKFSKFITGQCIEAVILGGLCFIGMTIFSMPYALLVSTIIGVTALVPIFGALIGTIPAAFIIFMVEPMTAVWFVILIVVIQQIEGNLIYPMVVGNSIGLSAIWVLLAITVGGSTFGILGILIGIPLFGVLYTLLSTITNSKLKEKNIKVEDID
ncbi:MULTISPECIES: AI-2E family transporter [Clostridium]|uniref:AI-2E family transporter n=1 Tax=Clostridium paraputrificum TaxID=29363 RepID=A0A1B8RL62_9CLOT|nr:MULTISPECIES: AI-2E family transporter [Clostridium]MBS6886919.1 AI-2E family transporter [Clostridium sp.]MDB2103365.1 AI-2E family transporter [Clostridium paraputrificum]MDB2109766.1 AI-2E family transporter [Clostridium paraputrificum]MDC0803839.1 AI-2E family transporter [Clostridium paraputrificum]MDU1585839.1 AI-2E family transporter [Clostridium sp.]